MAYELYYPWHKHPRLIGLSFIDQVTIDDFQGALAQTATLMDNSQVQMHVVFDYTTATQLPKEMVQLLVGSPIIRHPQRGRCVFIKGNEFVVFVAKIVAHQTQIPIDFVEDANDAWEFFNEMGIC